jgi:hypothetical protein
MYQRWLFSAIACLFATTYVCTLGRYGHAVALAMQTDVWLVKVAPYHLQGLLSLQLSAMVTGALHGYFKCGSIAGVFNEFYCHEGVLDAVLVVYGTGSKPCGFALIHSLHMWQGLYFGRNALCKPTERKWLNRLPYVI